MALTLSFSASTDESVLLEKVAIDDVLTVQATRDNGIVTYFQFPIHLLFLLLLTFVYDLQLLCHVAHENCSKVLSHS